jgi:hypothetical protein
MKRSIAVAALLSLSTFAYAGQSVPLAELISGNSQRIQQVKKGMPRAEVLQVMKELEARIPGSTVGNPYKTKTFEQGGVSYEVLYYITEQPTAGKEALTTPVIIKQGAVVGMGLDALRAIKQ